MDKNNKKLIRLFSSLLETIDTSKEDAIYYIKEMIDTVLLYCPDTTIEPKYFLSDTDSNLYHIQRLLGDIAKNIISQEKVSVQVIEALVVKLKIMKHNLEN